MPSDITLAMMRESLYAAVVADALDSLGFRHQSPRVCLRPYSGDTLLVGRCKTTLWADMFHEDPRPYELELRAVDSCQADDVMIAAASGSCHSALWGELLSTAARNSGCLGAIVDGYHSDMTRSVRIGGTGDGPEAEMLTMVLAAQQAGMATIADGVATAAVDTACRSVLTGAGLGDAFTHGTGHGVGHFLNVHEGPQSLHIQRCGGTPLEPGNMLTIEPGHYEEGGFGIRIENLVLVVPAGIESEGDYLGFETLTFVPLDRRLVDKDLLSPAEIGWGNDYHAKVRDIVAPQLDGADLEWLEAECAPL